MTTTDQKKHPCPDCRQCQGCSDTRCRVCRGRGAPGRFAGMSIAEQLALHDLVNRGELPEGHYGPPGCRKTE